MRFQTESGTWPTVAFAPAPTAAALCGNLTVGCAPLAGTGASPWAGGRLVAAWVCREAEAGGALGGALVVAGPAVVADGVVVVADEALDVVEVGLEGAATAFELGSPPP